MESLYSAIFKCGDKILLKNGSNVILKSIVFNTFLATNGTKFTYSDIDLGDLEFLRTYPSLLILIRKRCNNSIYWVCRRRYASVDTGGITWDSTPEGEEFWVNLLVNYKIPFERKSLSIF